MLIFAKEIRRHLQLYALALPGIVFLVMFAYVPMFGHLIAFKSFHIRQGIWGSPWVGFDNFQFFFAGRDWLKITFNTLFLNALFLASCLILALLLAVFLNEIRLKALKRISQSLLLMPYFISWFVVSMMMFMLLNSTDGLINRTLESAGLEPVAWYSKAGIWPLLLTFIYVWKFAGYYAIIFLAAIAGLSSELYESARIDGASRLQMTFQITLPLLRPTFLILVLLGVGRIFYGDFGMIYALVGDNGVLFPTTDVIDTYSFRALRQMGNFGMSSAVVLYQSVMGLITVLVVNGIVKRIDKDSSLF